MTIPLTLRSHFQLAHRIAKEFQLDAAYFEHEGDPRILLTYGGDKLAKLSIDPNVAISWIGAFFPLSTILTFEGRRVIISIAEDIANHTNTIGTREDAGSPDHGDGSGPREEGSNA